MSWHDLPWRDIIETAEWKEAVNQPVRTIRHRVELVTEDDAHVEDIAFTGGSVSVAFDAADTYELRLSVSDPDLVPVDSGDRLDSRSGYFLRVWWGLLVDNVWVEIPLGKYTPEDPNTNEDADKITTDLVGRDPLAIARHGDYGVTAIDVGGALVSTALDRLFTYVCDAPTQIGDTTVVMPVGFEFGEQTPSDDWNETAALAGWVVVSDPDGIIVVDTVPGADQTREELHEGVNCSVISLSVARKTSDIRNVIYAVCTNAEIDPPVWAMAEDDDEGSPSWVGGPMGRRTKTIESDKLASTEAAQNLADSMLALTRLPTEEVSMSMRQRPDMLHGDQFNVAFSRSGAAGLYRLAGFTIPLSPPGGSPDPMSVRFYSRSYA